MALDEGVAAERAVLGGEGAAVGEELRSERLQVERLEGADDAVGRARPVAGTADRAAALALTVRRALREAELARQIGRARARSRRLGEVRPTLEQVRQARAVL